MRTAFRDYRTAEVFNAPGRATKVPEPSKSFWESLLTNPAELNGPQCSWVQRTRLHDFIHTVRDSDRRRLGPLDDDQRFPGLAAMF